MFTQQEIKKYYERTGATPKKGGTITGKTPLPIKPYVSMPFHYGGVPQPYRPIQQTLSPVPPLPSPYVPKEGYDWTQGGYGGGNWGASQPQAINPPPTPWWLPQFAPWLTAGQPVSPGALLTPSGQQWGRTPWSIREGLRGFAEYAGGRPLEDILQHMYSMQPQDPRGAGFRRWAPAQQWT